jgi:uncharacterized membrane protein
MPPCIKLNLKLKLNNSRCTLKVRSEDVDGMGETDLSSYVQSLGTSLTLDALVVTFIFTVLTLVLLEASDVTSILAQATLLVLMVAFSLALLSLGIMDRRINMLNPYMRVRRPSTPGWRFHNLLLLSSILLMNMSIVLMMFYRGLTSLGSISAAIVVLTFTVYLAYISPYRLKRGQNT